MMKLICSLAVVSLLISWSSSAPMEIVEKAGNGTLEKFMKDINDALSVPRRDIERGFVRQDGTYKDPEEYFGDVPPVTFLKKSSILEKELANSAKSAEIDLNENTVKKYYNKNDNDDISDSSIESESEETEAPQFKPFEPRRTGVLDDQDEPNEYDDKIASALRKKRETDAAASNPVQSNRVQLRSYKRLNGFWNKLESTFKTNLLVAHLYW